VKCKILNEHQIHSGIALSLFEKLKKVFSETAKNLGRKAISKKEIDSILEELQMNLMENDVAYEVVDEMTSKIKTEILNLKLERKENSDQVITTKLYSYLRELFLSTNTEIDIIQSILEKKKSKTGPYSIIFLGINGTGKTTTIAKFCKLLRDHAISVVLAAADTHRAGAIEQITHHGNKLNVKVISQRYGADPSAVARDALEHAKKNYIDAVLIDTAGRMQTSKNLMEEVSKIIRVIKPDMKIFVGDSLAGNDTVNQAREFFHYTNYDGSILTKSDADSKGGAAISIAYLTHKPILYLGVGQGYEDLAEFDHDKFLDSIFKDKIYEKTISHSDVDTVASLPDNDTATTLDADTNILSNGNENTSNEYDKLLTTDQQTSAFLVEPEQLIPSKMNHEQERIHEETSEAKSKKGSFFNKFFRDKKEDGTDNVENVSNEEIRPKKRNKNESKNKSENVVYLTDDDLDDLIK
jgi:fused signal recognition particle receptor